MRCQLQKVTGMVEVSVADYIASFLSLRQVPAVFELSGGMIAFLTDAIYRDGRMQIINVRHEQAAGFAAEGASRISGIPSVALATSGPGATNLVTAIGSAYFDSTPIIFITGQVNQAELKISKEQRQNGFQELDIVQVVKGVTKHAIQVRNVEDLVSELERAWNLSVEGRPGPVLIDIPIDVQQMKVRMSPKILETPSRSTQESISIDDLASAIEIIAKSEHPLILAGGGIRTSGATAKFREFAERAGIPVVYSLMGCDSLSSESKLRVGLIGSYGNRWANKALFQADTLLVLGSRLDVRQTGNSVSDFVNGKNIIRVDIDDYELDGRVKANINFKCSLSAFLEAESIKDLNVDSTPFLSLIASWKTEFPAEAEQIGKLALNPNSLMQWISKTFAVSNGYLVDVGQHQMWAAQSLHLGPEQRFITSGGMGAMGFSIPAAIGAATVKNGRWVVIAGDGCTQLAIAELQTLKHYGFPIAVCVINNYQLGMVAQFQEENMDSRFVATREGYSTPDFTKVAHAFGIPAMRIESLDDLHVAEEFVAKWETGPILIEIVVSNEAKALPKLNRTASLGDL